jgi:uncharacterized protein DUF6114
MTTQTFENTASDGAARPPAALRALHAFRHWRKSRPFPSGLLILLAGIEIWLAPYSSIGVMIHEGIAGFSAVFVGTLLIVFGLTVWFAPAYRAFAGIASILLGLIALPTINIGGFVLGTLLALTGGGLAVAWTPRPGWVAPTWRQKHTAKAEAKAETEPVFAEASHGEGSESFAAAEAELEHRREAGAVEAEREDGSAGTQD